MDQKLEKTIHRLADIEDIKQLKARYASACDDDYNPEKLAPLFAEDAVWDGSILGYAEGREGIREFFGAASTLVPFAVHQVSNPLIEIDGDTANGQWFLWQPMVFQGQALWLSATYDDKYVRVDGNWMFQHLKLNIRMLTPYEEGPAKTRIIEVDL
jgi:SnoaL-like protein